MYVPLDVNFPDDDKIEAVGFAAAGLYCQALCIAKRIMTDGRLTRVKLRKLGADDDLIDVCVRADLFRTLPDDPDGLQITAWLDHNESVEEIDQKRSKDAHRKRLTRAKRPRGHAETSDGTPPGVRPLEVEVEGQVETEVEVEKTASLVVAEPASSPAVPESSSYHPSFAEWWDRYPRKVGKQAAHKAWLKAKRSRGHVALLAAITAHAEVWDADGTDPQFIPHPATWLNEGRYDDPPPQATKARTKVDRTRIALVQGATQLDQGGPTFAERFAAAGGQPAIEAGLA